MALWMRRRYPTDTAKLVARDIDAHPRTVEGWFVEGAKPPIWRHFTAMVEAWGPAFVAFVLAPDSEFARRERLEQRLAALEDGIRAIREAL